MRNLILTTVLALTFVVVGASAAQALEVRDGTTEELCPAVNVNGNTVTGGCLIEDLEGVWAIQDAFGVYDRCTGRFDIRIDGSATVSYAVNQQLDCQTYVRSACKDVNGATIPWPYSAPNQMPVCVAGPMNSWASVTWAYGWGSSGELLSMSQTSAPQGFGSGWFTNEGETEEIHISI